MALRKVISNIGHRLHRMSSLSARQYNSEAYRDGNPNEAENGHNLFEYDAKNIEPEGLNVVQLIGYLHSSPVTISAGNGTAFYIAIPQYKHDGGSFRVLVRVVAYGPALPDEVRANLTEGSRLLIQGRIGSRTNNVVEGQIAVLKNFVVAKSVANL